MAMPTPGEAAGNWSRGLAGATTKITAGVQRVTENPAQKAIAAGPEWQRAMADPRTYQKWTDGLAATTLEGWRGPMLNKGIGRIATGATQAQPKFEAFAREFFPWLQQGVGSLPPRGDLEQNLQRSNEMARHNAAFRRRSR